MAEHEDVTAYTDKPRRRRAVRSLLEERHTRKLVAAQLEIRVGELRNGSYDQASELHRNSARTADHDLADLLADVAAELRSGS